MTDQHFGVILNIALGTDLMLDIKGTDTKLKSVLVGHEPKEFILVRAPVGYVGVRKSLFEGNKVTVRYMQHGNVYGFESFILGLSSKPKALLFLDYPSTVAQVSLRKNERYDCYIPCEAKFEEREEKATIMDLSLSGCRCLLPSNKNNTNSLPPINAEMLLSFNSPADGEPMELKAKIINAKEDQSTALVGMAFDQSVEANKSRIKKLTGFLSLQ